MSVLHFCFATSSPLGAALFLRLPWVPRLASLLGLCRFAAIWVGLDRCGLQLGKLLQFSFLHVHDSQHLHTLVSTCACRA